MARRKRPNDLPAIADVVALIIINLFSQIFPSFGSWIFLYLIPHVFVPDYLCLNNVLLSHIPLFPPYTPPHTCLFGLI